MVSTEISRILTELAGEIETTSGRLAHASPRSSHGGDRRGGQPDGQLDPASEGGLASGGADAHTRPSGADLLAIAQDLRETASAALQSKPTRFWIDGLLARVRATGREELRGAVANAEAAIAGHYS